MLDTPTILWKCYQDKELEEEHDRKYSWTRSCVTRDVSLVHVVNGYIVPCTLYDVAYLGHRYTRLQARSPFD
jgi:hypothetical protein